MEGILSVESSVSEGSPLFWNRIPRLSDAEEETADHVFAEAVGIDAESGGYIVGFIYPVPVNQIDESRILRAFIEMPAESCIHLVEGIIENGCNTLRAVLPQRNPDFEICIQLFVIYIAGPATGDLSALPVVGHRADSPADLHPRVI